MTNINVSNEHIGKKVEVFLVGSQYQYGIIVGVNSNNNCFDVFFPRGKFSKTIVSVDISQITKYQNNIINLKF